MGNFLEILQVFKKKSFQYKKYIIVSEAYKSRRDACDCGAISSFFWF